jgi:hypothetical protein
MWCREQGVPIDGSPCVNCGNTLETLGQHQQTPSAIERFIAFSPPKSMYTGRTAKGRARRS